MRGPRFRGLNRKVRIYANNIGADIHNKRIPYLILICCKALIFIKKPVRGGSPAIFIIRMVMLIDISVRKIGSVQTLYKRK